MSSNNYVTARWLIVVNISDWYLNPFVFCYVYGKEPANQQWKKRFFVDDQKLTMWNLTEIWVMKIRCGDDHVYWLVAVFAMMQLDAIWVIDSGSHLITNRMVFHWNMMG